MWQIWVHFQVLEGSVLPWVGFFCPFSSRLRHCSSFPLPALPAEASHHPCSGLILLSPFPRLFQHVQAVAMFSSALSFSAQPSLLWLRSPSPLAHVRLGFLGEVYMDLRSLHACTISFFFPNTNSFPFSLPSSPIFVKVWTSLTRLFWFDFYPSGFER